MPRASRLRSAPFRCHARVSSCGRAPTSEVRSARRIALRRSSLRSPISNQRPTSPKSRCDRHARIRSAERGCDSRRNDGPKPRNESVLLTRDRNDDSEQCLSGPRGRYPDVLRGDPFSPDRNEGSGQRITWGSVAWSEGTKNLEAGSNEHRTASSPITDGGNGGCIERAATVIGVSIWPQRTSDPQALHRAIVRDLPEFSVSSTTTPDWRLRVERRGGR